DILPDFEVVYIALLEGLRISAEERDRERFSLDPVDPSGEPARLDEGGVFIALPLGREFVGFSADEEIGAATPSLCVLSIERKEEFIACREVVQFYLPVAFP